MVSKEAIGRCPVCDDVMHITMLECDSCGTKIESRFDICKFCRLTPEQKSFLETFIKNRGSIKDVERELSISYPTVRAKLNVVLAAMGFSKEDGKESAVNAPKKRGRAPKNI